MSPNQLCLHCFGPYSFFDNPSLPCVSKCEHGVSQGVYLWTLPIEGTYRVNYVGKTSNRNGFGERFAQELSYAAKGKTSGGKKSFAPTVDCRLWYQGERIVLNQRPTDEENAAAWPEMERTYRALYVFLVPIVGDDQLRARVESAIAWHLWNECDKCRRFMCRPTQSRRRIAMPPLSFALRFPDGAKICGLEGPISECVSIESRGLPKADG
jgi:hypothetical protein